MMNDFGNDGGFDAILHVLENVPAGEEINLDSICYMSTMLTMPINLWHKDWLAEFAERVGTSVKKQLYEANDKVHRTLDKGAYSQAVNSVSYVYGKIRTADEL